MMFVDDNSSASRNYFGDGARKGGFPNILNIALD